jgi:hypothetical protein
LLASGKPSLQFGLFAFDSRGCWVAQGHDHPEPMSLMYVNQRADAMTLWCLLRRYLWNLPCRRDFVQRENADPSRMFSPGGRVSEVDLMGAIYPLSVHRRIERQWAERIKSLRQIRGLVGTATERALQGASIDSSLIPIPAGSVVDPVQPDRPRPRG